MTLNPNPNPNPNQVSPLYIVGFGDGGAPTDVTARYVDDYGGSCVARTDAGWWQAALAACSAAAARSHAGSAAAGSAAAHAGGGAGGGRGVGRGVLGQESPGG